MSKLYTFDCPSVRIDQFGHSIITYTKKEFIVDDEIVYYTGGNYQHPVISLPSTVSYPGER
jgi:hypothetical protein